MTETPETPAATQARETLQASSDPSTPRKGRQLPGTPTTPDSGTKILRPIKIQRARSQNKKGSKDDPRLPGDPANLSSFWTKIWEKEGTLTGYLGFNDICDLRQLAMSPLVLYFFNGLAEDRSAMLMEKVLELIKDKAVEVESDDDPCSLYPSEHSGNLHYRSALRVAQATRALQTARSGNTHIVFKESEIEAAASLFHARFGKTIPRLTPNEPYRLPDMGKFPNRKESYLEDYARTFSLLKYISLSLAKVWPTRFGADKWNPNLQISESQVPFWMRMKKATVVESAPDVPAASLEMPERPALNMKFVWKLDAKGKEGPEKFRDHIKDEELDDDLPNLEQNLKIEPAASREQVRDDVRRAFKLDDLQGQIHKLRLELKAQEESDEAVKDESLVISAMEWSKVQDLLWSGKYDTSNSAFYLTTRLADEGEVIWESTVPLVVERYMAFKDGDVAALGNEELMPAIEGSATEGKLDDVEESDPGAGLVSAVRDNSNERIFLDPEKMFEGKKAKMITFYEGHDPTVPGELKSWQRKVAERLTLNDDFRLITNNIGTKLGKIKLSAQERHALATARTEGEHRMFSAGEASRDDSDVSGQYCDLNMIHTGTSAQVGLPLVVSAQALDMEASKDEEGRLMYRSRDAALGHRLWFPWQVNGIATCIIAAIGYIPVLPDASDDVKRAAQWLRGLATGGNMVCDQTGLGKTLVIVANLYIASRVPEYNNEGAQIYRVMMLVVPAGVLKQWADEIFDHFKYFTLIISYDESGLTDAKYKPNFVSATAMKEFPHSKARWPVQFHYIFNESDPRCARTIILTSNDCNVTRSLKSIWHTVGFDEESGAPIQKLIRKSRWRNRVGRAVVDEGQKLKDESSRRWLAFHDIQAPINWIVGATPMSNVSTDFIAQLKIIWIGARRELVRDNAAYEWAATRWRTMKLWKEAAAFKPTDKRRLALLHPPSVRHLLETATKVEIASYFHLCEDQICLKRFMGSKLPLRFDSDEYFDMAKAMKPYFIHTLHCEHKKEEQAAHQILHREASRRFVETLRGFSIKQSRARAMGNKEQHLYPVAEMRELVITATSTMLRLFHEACKHMDVDTLVETIQEYRGNGFDGFRFVRFMCTRLNLALPTTAYGYLEILCQGSPIARALIHQLCLIEDGKFLRPRTHGKFIVAEDVPLNAMFLEWVLNMIGLKVVVFHAGLSAQARNDLQEEFNDPKSDIDGLINMYNVGGEGRNFWLDCHTLYMATSGKHEAAEKQQAGRIIRAPQKENVQIIKLMLKNSIAAYRESRKRHKYMIELATRAHDPVIQRLLIRCLNEWQAFVKEAQDDPANRALMEQLKEKSEIDENKEEMFKAGAVADSVDLVELPAPEGPRKRQQVRRFADATFVKDREIQPGDQEPHNLSGARKKSRKMKGMKKRRRVTGKVDEDEEEEVQEEEEADLEVEDCYSEYEPSDSGDSNYSNSDMSEEDSEREEEDPTEESTTPKQATSSKNDEEKLTNAQRRAARKAAAAAMRNEEQEEEGVRQLKLLLTADPERVYTVEDLSSEKVLERALEITYCLRIGQRPDKVPSVHINYSAINHQLSEKIKLQTNADDSRELLKDMLAATSNVAPDAPLETATVSTVPPADSTSAEGAREYSKELAPVLLQMCKARKILRNETRKEEYIQLLEADDARIQVAKTRESLKPRPLKDYSTEPPEELRKKLVGLNVPGAETMDQDDLVYTAHTINVTMFKKKKVEYEEWPDFYLILDLARRKGVKIKDVEEISRKERIVALRQIDKQDHISTWREKFIVFP
ncbi:uncharacterized protein N0V89_012429 [Didymosphaeria variabile]|uniref:SNF2 N-terminal domain-containing protein n=1 Tax=Didymosphaeria variabile TaxID=1932322 RepID=A0A9W9C650_9PLEO|nr:uncharacterized protein N0V89_012429 [Didymosphaeria variabile]KAJ4344685.1 hypothetical protein N0V89_012429 [Didymosphaeria variabile]